MNLALDYAVALAYSYRLSSGDQGIAAVAIWSRLPTVVPDINKLNSKSKKLMFRHEIGESNAEQAPYKKLL